MCWVGTGYKAVAGSEVGSAVGGLVRRTTGGCSPCVVPRGMGLLPVLCSVVWRWDMCLLPDPHVCAQIASPLPGARKAVTSAVLGCT